MPALRYVALISTALLAPAASADNFKACVAMVEDTMRGTYMPDKRAPGFSLEKLDATFRWIMASLYTECARRACKEDVRECIKVPDYEDAAKQLQKKLQMWPSG